MRIPHNLHTWFPGYAHSRLRHLMDHHTCEHKRRVWLAIADHFEPLGMGASYDEALERVICWSRHWPQIAKRHQDATGSQPKYTFFYPEEEYRSALMDPLAAMSHHGVADVEIHIHHDGEGAQNFVDRMGNFRDLLHSRYGLLRRYDGEIKFGFIHGNWALDNSRRDGRLCGLNDELTLLQELGCYADFTMPSGYSETQSRMVNQIYCANDDPKAPKSYDSGKPLTPGTVWGPGLLMIPGPLGLRWRGRLLPRLETGEMAGYDLPTAYRFQRWLDLAPRIAQDTFIKLYTHGCQERNFIPLLGNGLIDSGLDRLFTVAAEICQRQGIELRYVSTWEMYEAVQAAVGLSQPSLGNDVAPELSSVSGGERPV